MAPRRRAEDSGDDGPSKRARTTEPEDTPAAWAVALWDDGPGVDGALAALEAHVVDVETSAAVAEANALVPLLRLAQVVERDESGEPAPGQHHAVLSRGDTALCVLGRVVGAVAQELQELGWQLAGDEDGEVPVAFVDLSSGEQSPVHPALTDPNFEAAWPTRAVYALPPITTTLKRPGGGGAVWPVTVEHMARCADGTPLAVLRVLDVQEGATSRHLVLGTWEGPDGFRESEQDVDDEPGEHLGSWYSVTLAGAAALTTRGDGRVLVLGLGGGVLTSFLARHLPRARVEAVELHDEVARVAREHFGVTRAGSVDIHVGDAGAFVRAAAKETYGAVVIDCYTSGVYPESLGTAAFWRDVRAALKPSGVVAVNVGEGDDELQQRFRDAFPSSAALVDPEDAESVVLVGLRAASAGTPDAVAEEAFAPAAWASAAGACGGPAFPFALEEARPDRAKGVVRLTWGGALPAAAEEGGPSAAAGDDGAQPWDVFD